MADAIVNLYDCDDCKFRYDPQNFQGVYLRRWQESKRQIRVTELDERRTWTTAPEKAARETDFNRVEHAFINREELPPLLWRLFWARLKTRRRTLWTSS